MNKDRTRTQLKTMYRFICGTLLVAAASVSFAYVWDNFISTYNVFSHLRGPGNFAMSVGVYSGFVFAMFRVLGCFRIGVDRMMNIIVSIVLGLLFADIAMVFASMAITGQWRYFPIILSSYAPMWAVQAPAIGLLGAAFIAIYKLLFPPLEVLEINGEYEHDLKYKVDSRPDKYKIVKSIDCSMPIDELEAEMKKHDAVLLNDLPAEIKNKILKICLEDGLRVYFTPKISDIIVKASSDLNLFDTPLCLCRNVGMTFRQRFFKRLTDIVLSLVALIIASPFMLITAIAIKIEDHGPVFFRQERVTKDGKHFMILKFRSMIVDAEKDGKSHPAGEKDPRITKVGNFIRATRIDELPQILNILKGDMSIVGPRPERWEHVEQYTKEIQEFPLRLKVKGGLTGYAQVYGKYNTNALDKLKLDLMYIENYSLLLDFQIICETVRVIFQKESTEGFDAEAAKELHDKAGVDSSEEK